MPRSRLAGSAAACLAGLCLLLALPAQAQYFGRNKVQYDDFEFHVLGTEHFDVYFYPESEEKVQDVARMAERWYRRHSRTFVREFDAKKPLIFYANDADFQQTNVIRGSIGQGTGGVTESIKERVVMPLTGIYQETDHVLGHELVHSFQYDIALSRSDSLRFSLGQVPLWLVEGMAEYLSIGRRDGHTAMWLRDAALRDDLPTTTQLTNDPYTYFPYRYGQAYMAYVGGKYGDGAVTNLFKTAGRTGLDSAFVYVLGVDGDSLSAEWAQAVKDAYLPLTTGRDAAADAGRLVLAKDLDAGDMNVSPVASPDGQYVAFLSERDLFKVNLFIADAETGEVVKKLRGSIADPHFDAIRFINSAGSWSPDGQRFAFVTFTEGDNEIALLDLNSGDIERRIRVAGVSALSNPAWSPDGRRIAFSGLDGGVSDLYVLDLETNAVRQLTDDRYADLQPAWSPDGRTLAFTTDRGEDGTDFRSLRFGTLRVGLLDVASGAVETLRPFGDVLHHNPQFAPDGRSVYFVAEADGFKDVFRHELPTGTTYRVTHLQTGVSGITALSPAMSVAQQSGRVLFSVFADNTYNVYALEADEAQGTLLAGPAVADAAGAAAPVPPALILPPHRDVDAGLVGSYLDDPLGGLPADETYATESYGARLHLDYVAPPSVGVSVGGPFGAGVAGGVGLFFSDMLGNHNLGVVVQANGTFKDIGGQVSYTNLKNRFNYGASVGHIPYLFGGVRGGFTSDGSQVVQQIRQRIYYDHADVVGSYPFTTSRRVELTGGFVRYGFDYEVDEYIITPLGVQRNRRDLDELEPDPVYFARAGAALVGDFSVFGFTSPLSGGRYRLQVTPHVGSEQFVRVQADVRRYGFFQPFTLAVRALHVGNYGADEGTDGSDRLFTDEYLGYANSLSFVRGYSFSSFEPYEACTPSTSETSVFSCRETDRLFGTRLALASVELRLPLLGNESLGLLNFPYLPTELSLFSDIGVAWTAAEAPEWDFWNEPLDTAKRVPVSSVGASTRFNVLGYMVLEFFYAKPFQRPDKGAHFGFQLVPGW